MSHTAKAFTERLLALQSDEELRKIVVADLEKAYAGK